MVRSSYSLAQPPILITTHFQLSVSPYSVNLQLSSTCEGRLLHLRPEDALCRGVRDPHKIRVNFSLCLTKYHAMKTYWGNGVIDPRIRNLGTRWKWVVSFALRPFYPRGKGRRYLLDRVGGSQGQSGSGGEEKKSQSNAGNRTPVV